MSINLQLHPCYEYELLRTALRVSAMAAIAHVFTITYVAEMLGVDEEWLHELSIDMFPEDGCLRVYHGEDDAVTAFTKYGIECLKQTIADARATPQPPRRNRTAE